MNFEEENITLELFLECLIPCSMWKKKKILIIQTSFSSLFPSLTISLSNWFYQFNKLNFLKLATYILPYSIINSYSVLTILPLKYLWDLFSSFSSSVTSLAGAIISPNLTSLIKHLLFSGFHCYSVSVWGKFLKHKLCYVIFVLKFI